MGRTRGAVLFDVDGTLVDSTYLHTLAWWRGLTDAGHRLAMADVHRLIGMGSSELLTELIGHDDPGLSDAHSRHYQRLKGELQALPGARELVAEVARRRGTVVLATSAKQHDLDDLLRVLDLGDLLDHVVHSADVEHAKPEGDIFARALEAAGCDASQAMVVGDSPWDVIAAAKVGIDTVAVQTGGHGAADLLGSGALAVFRDPVHLLDNFADSPLGARLA
ncbi:MAG TPA: HAD family hydrolase [Acidimicrobiales bacterium]|nr:HAD family hydrolase [Acidimicrobiales bacterium]